MTIVGTIRVGAKLLQRYGPKKPMVWGTSMSAVGIICTSLTFLLTEQYAVAAVYTAPQNLPEELVPGPEVPATPGFGS